MTLSLEDDVIYMGDNEERKDQEGRVIEFGGGAFIVIEFPTADSEGNRRLTTLQDYVVPLGIDGGRVSIEMGSLRAPQFVDDGRKTETDYPPRS